MKEKIVLGILIFSVLMIIVLAFIIIQGSMTGKVIEKVIETEDKVAGKASCTDSDGKNYGIKGIVNYCEENGNCNAKEDSCSDKKLTEGYCENNEVKFEEHGCEDGCDNGACLIIAENYKTIVTGSGGGGSSGGGVSSGGSVSAPSGETYDLGELSGEQVLDIVKYDNVKFKISGQEHTLTLNDNTHTEATMSVGSNNLILSVGKDTNLDLNSDSVSDLYIKLKSINIISGKVKLVLSLPY